METVTVRVARTHLSSLLARAEQGEEFVIAREGVPLVPIAVQPLPRHPDRMAGRIWMAEDFDVPLPDHVLRAFEGRDS